jgi:prefoldin subunit 5
MLDENPMTVGALAVGAGAAIGLAIPETSKEHEVMGEARDTVVEKAQDVQQRAQQVAEEAQGAAQQEAENQGLK